MYIYYSVRNKNIWEKNLPLRLGEIVYIDRKLLTEAVVGEQLFMSIL